MDSGSNVDSIRDLLNALNSIYIQQSMQKLIQFVEKYIPQQNPNSKMAALVVFQSLLEFGDRNILDEILNRGFFGLINFIQNEQIYLKLAALEMMYGISFFHPHIMFIDQNFMVYNNEFIEILNLTPQDKFFQMSIPPNTQNYVQLTD